MSPICMTARFVNGIAHSDLHHLHAAEHQHPWQIIERAGCIRIFIEVVEADWAFHSCDRETACHCIPAEHMLEYPPSPWVKPKASQACYYTQRVYCPASRYCIQFYFSLKHVWAAREISAAGRSLQHGTHPMPASDTMINSSSRLGAMAAWLHRVFPKSYGSRVYYLWQPGLHIAWWHRRSVQEGCQCDLECKCSDFASGNM